MTRLNWLVAACAAVLAACSGTGGTGAITGTVTVGGAKRADVSVDLLGPRTGGAVTDQNGAFTLNGLPDGDFVVRASVPGTREGTKVASVTVKGGKSSASPTLAFTTETPVTISGHVIFSDGSDATGVVVTAAGPVTKVITTGAGGAFSFAGVPPGGYVLSADVADTREQHLSVGANAIADLDVGNLTFTPSGRVPGTVTFNGAPVSAAQLVVTGTSLVATSGAQGQFEFASVPTGAQTLLARVGEAPFFRSATASVTVTRGENASVELALSDAPLPTGTVSGVVRFETGTNSPVAITVSSAGTSFTTHPSATGDFSLELPIGNHRLTATAPHYPTQLLGTVTVAQGQTSWLPAQALSFFVPIFTNTAGNGVFVETVYSDESDTPPTHTFELLSLCDNAVYYQGGEGDYDCLSYSLRLLNLATAELIPVYFGDVDQPVLSRDGAYVAWSTDDALWVYTVATRTTKWYALPREDTSWRFNFEHFGHRDGYFYLGSDYYYWSPNGAGVASNGGPGIQFSADGLSASVARYFYVSAYVNGSYVSALRSRVSRVTLATGDLVSTPGPQLLADGGLSLGFGQDMRYVAPGQWTWTDDPGDGGVELRAFTSGVTTTIFQGTSSTDPVPWQWQTTEDGGARLSLLRFGATAPIVVQGIEGTVAPSNLSGTPQYPVFDGVFSYEDGGSEMKHLLITAATGASTALPANLSGYSSNADETALLVSTTTGLDDGGTLYQAWLQALPPTSPATMLAESTTSFQGSGWLTPATGYVSFGPADAASGASLVVFTNGTITSSLQSVPGDSIVYWPNALLQRTGAGWKAFIGDTTRSLAVPTSTPMGIACVPSEYPGVAAASAAAFSVDDGRDGFMSVNVTTGDTATFPLSQVSWCARVGTEVAGLGTAQLQGQYQSALFFFNSGDSLSWRGGAYDGDDVHLGLVGSEASITGLLATTSDGHTLGFGALK